MELQAVFIDARYAPTNAHEASAFEKNSTKLMRFAKTKSPFHCKDVKVVLTELRQKEVVLPKYDLSPPKLAYIIKYI